MMTPWAKVCLPAHAQRNSTTSGGASLIAVTGQGVKVAVKMASGGSAIKGLEGIGLSFAAGNQMPTL